MSTDGPWLLVKRDLYYRPNGEGYTGIRDNAGRYTYEEAKAHCYDAGPNGNSVTMICLADAPEFSKACWDDLARKHLQDKVDALTEVLHDARLQIEYLHDKFTATGTGNTVLARINAVLAK